MNEELKIIIKAVNDEAKKGIKEVKDALGGVEEESSKVDKAMKGMAKGVAVAVGAFAAMAAAIVNLGKNSMEFQKSYSRLISGFQSSGSTVQQATETYKNLYRFLGEADTATEAANLLAQITTNTEDLAEWTTILQGVYAKFPSSIPVESLAEAANETAKVGKVTGTLADAYNWLGVSEDAVNEKLATMNTYAEREAFLRSTLTSLYGDAASTYERNNEAMLAYNESQVALDLALAEATRYVTPLLTQFNNLAASLLQVLKPAFETIIAVVMVFVKWVSAAVNFIGKLFGAFSGKGASAGNAVKASTDKVKTSIGGAASGANGLGDALGNAAKQAKELKRQTMGFDELNVVSKPTEAAAASTVGAGGGGVGASNIEIPQIDTSAFGLDNFDQTLKDVEEKLKGILVLVGLVGTALLAWKIKDLLKDMDAFKGKLKTASGTLLIVAGALLLVKGYSDAWANGINWANFTEILVGIGLIVGGIALAFGSTAAAIALVVGGIAMLIIGVKDLVTNGYSMEAVIMVLVGAIAVAVGIMWAFNAALLANPITWIVIAIAALVAAFIILWNECEGFRNFWKNLWQGIKDVFHAVVEWIKNAFNAVVTFFKENWQALLMLLVNPFAGAFKLLYDNCDGFRAFIDKWVKNIGQFFKDLWQGIKNTFSSVGKWFSDVFTSAWNGIKKAFSAVSSFFTGVWNTIKSLFSKVGSTIGNAVSGAFKSAINWVLEKAISIINGFLKTINAAIGIINKIPGVNIKKLALLEVPKLATGGIVTSSTIANIGEAGREAVLPLDRNTEWMDTLADRIANRSNTPSRIVLMLDSKELGYATINSINGITKQTGALQLALV